MRRVNVRSRDNLTKKVLLQAAAFNLALILLSITWGRRPRGLAQPRFALQSSITFKISLLQLKMGF